MTETDRRGWERHIQTILSTFIIMLVAWLANTANENAASIGILVVQIENLTVQITKLENRLETSSTDRFTGLEGRRLEQRLRDLEQQFNMHLAETN
jgi:hypothetical protein